VDELERRVAGLGLERDVPRPLEDEVEEPPDEVVVVDDEDAEGRRHGRAQVG
jgi:hypothetical protein